MGCHKAVSWHLSCSMCTPTTSLYWKDVAGSAMQMEAQQHGFPEAESTLEKALSDMSTYYLQNHLRSNQQLPPQKQGSKMGAQHNLGRHEKHRYRLQSLSFSSAALTVILKQASMNSRREKLPPAVRQDCPVCSAESSLSVSDNGSLFTCIRDHTLTDDPVRINNNTALPWNTHSSPSGQDEASTSRFVRQLLDEQDGATQSTSTSSAISSTEGTSTSPSPTSSLTSCDCESDPDCLPGSALPNEDLRSLGDSLTYAAEHNGVLVVGVSFEQGLESELDFPSTHSSGPQWSSSINAVCERPTASANPASSPAVSRPLMSDGDVALHVIMEQDDLCESSCTVYSSISPSNSLASALDATSTSFSMSVFQAPLFFKENLLMTFEDKEGKDVPGNQPASAKETRPNMSSLQEAQQAEGIHGSDANIQPAPNSLSPQEDHDSSNEEALNSTYLPEAIRNVGRIATNGFLQESLASYCEPETAMDKPLSVSFQDEEYAQFLQGASQSPVQFKGQSPGLFDPAGSTIEKTILSPIYMTNRLHDQGCEGHFRVNFYCQGVDPDIISSYDPLPEASYSVSCEAFTDYEDEELCCASLQATAECSPVWSGSTSLLSHEPSPRYGQDEEIIDELMTLGASQEVCCDTAKVEISGEDKPYVFLDFANNKLLENVHVYEAVKTTASSSSQDEDSPEPSTSVLQLSEQDETEGELILPPTVRADRENFSVLDNVPNHDFANTSAVSVKRSLDSSEEENEGADNTASCPKRQHKRTRNESDTEAALSSLDADRDGPSTKRRRK
ncbi:hypothetical protein MHYP_G00149880 [Metynnis hypsauchen]